MTLHHMRQRNRAGKTSRKPLSKRTRFGIFRRDLFTCQYCGKRPPEVVLEVDHVVSVVNGGSDEDHNLLTACFDCNRGKGASPVEIAPVDIGGRIKLQNERAEQVAAYEAMLAEQRQREEVWIDDIICLYEEVYPGWTLLDRVRPTIRNFLKTLPFIVVFEAMELACVRMHRDHAFRYFCGICWNRIRNG